jgi:hypothetical protein
VAHIARMQMMLMLLAVDDRGGLWYADEGKRRKQMRIQEKKSI